MQSKEAIRATVWEALRAEKAARFPFPLQHRIPNFRGAEAAAERLFASEAWQRAFAIKCNPDAPQRPVRARALAEGRTVYVAVPRLREARCFLRLDPARIPAERHAEAATIGGAARLGEPVTPGEVPRLDLVVAGSVAVHPGTGARVGKGGGYADLEYALLRDAGAVDAATPIVTTLHDLQAREGEWAVQPWDIPVDTLYTPTRTVAVPERHARPEGVLWAHLDEAMRAAVPALADLAP